MGEETLELDKPGPNRSLLPRSPGEDGHLCKTHFLPLVHVAQDTSHLCQHLSGSHSRTPTEVQAHQHLEQATAFPSLSCRSVCSHSSGHDLAEESGQGEGGRIGWDFEMPPNTA